MRPQLLGGLLATSNAPALKDLARGRSDAAADPTWIRPRTSLAADVNGAKAFRGLAPAFRALGYDNADRVLVAPLFHHLWAVVYEADWAYEAHQASGADKPSLWWFEHLRSVLEDLRLLTGPVIRHLDGLPRYIELETAIMTDAAPVDEDRLTEAVRLRCADMLAFLTVAAELVDRRWALELVCLIAPLMSVVDMENDFHSTEEDAGARSFNTHNLAVAAWGGEAGRAWLDRTGARLLGEAAEALPGASTRALRSLWVLLKRPGSDHTARRLHLEALRPRKLLLDGLRRALLAGGPRPFEPHWRALDSSGARRERGLA